MVEEGWSLNDVEAFCDKYGIKLEKIEQETTAYAEGTIIGQSRTKGSTIIKGTTLKVTVAIKPIPQPAPTTEDDKKEEKEEPSEKVNDEE